MISHPVEGAIAALQESALRTFDSYQLDRIDRALDELLRNPSDESTPAEYRVRSAMGHAYEVLERRKTITPLVSLCAEHTDQGVLDWDYSLIEINEWLCSEPGISLEQRALLQALARGEDATTLAQREGLPVARVRERISRARRAGRQLWKTSVLAA
ncbi:hypothetical protein [Streptomyces sp. NBC_01304]|uniref:hypothetical protein n=1 Tax=Streptomyces sp. NBC_01304 TaxID=2903818 RepID=UPI002E10EBEE|nr:hypothetical protein OG430_33475 [Streptomyces sp. NBC_01304]